MILNIDLSTLPRRGKFINWTGTKGCKCAFLYDDICGDIEIIDVIVNNKSKAVLTVLYGEFIGKVSSDSFAKCKLGIVLKKISKEYKFEIGLVLERKHSSIKIVARERRTTGRKTEKWYQFTQRTLLEELINDLFKKQLALDNGIVNYFEIDCSVSLIDYIVKSCKSSGLLQFLGIKELDFDTLYHNKFHNLILKCKDIISVNPEIRFSQLLKLLGLEHYYDLLLILSILLIKLRNNRNTLLVYKDGLLVNLYESFSAFKRDTKGLNCYIATNRVMKKYSDELIELNGYTYRYLYK